MLERQSASALWSYAFAGGASVQYSVSLLQSGHCKTGQRPGTAQQLLTPEQAAEKVEQALKLCPQLTVIGVAGPGDTLASPHALETFRLLQKRYPHLIFCLSTNGLLLWEKAAALAEAGVKSVTVTMNAVDEAIARICSSVLYNGKRLTEEWERNG